MNIIEQQVPVEPSLAEELIAFWEAIFGMSFAGLRDVLAGGELGQNRDAFFLAREGTRLVGTSHLTIGVASRAVGGLGEVAVDPEFRGRGIAHAICATARDVFRDQRGEALFLGTTAPNAARVYGRLGWRALAGTHVMLLTFGPPSAEAYLEEHFRRTSPVSVAPATAADRTAMIPLLVSPHDWRVLDANVRVFSTRYATQSSCMGLYPRYQTIRVNGRGNWFAAHTDDGRVAGLATARFAGEERCRVDGFSHPLHLGCMAALIDESARWGRAQGASVVEAVVSEEDATKLAQFESVGFRAVGSAESLPLPDRELGMLCLELPAATGFLKPASPFRGG
jgi:GNAT superfamily N-acetyltransferase